MNIKISLFAICVCLIGFTQAQGELTYTVTDLGTLGGNTTTANNVTGHGQNAAGMIVGSSTTSDNSEHAFLYVRDKMYDLNTLCDLSQGEFKVLTVARTISDSCVIIGDGITTNGDKHAFKLTPVEVAGGHSEQVSGVGPGQQPLGEFLRGRTSDMVPVHRDRRAEQRSEPDCEARSGARKQRVRRDVGFR